LFTQGRLLRRTGYSNEKLKYLNPSDAPFPFLLETILPITSKLEKIFPDVGDERARQNEWYKEYRKRGENSETGTYELIISSSKAYHIYFIEYADKTGLELEMESVVYSKRDFNDMDIKVTPNHLFWLSPSMEDFLDKFTSTCAHSLYCEIPSLF